MSISSGQVRWLSLGAGVLLVATVTFASCTSQQQADSSATDSTTINESVDLQIAEGTGSTSNSSPRDTTTISDSTEVEVAEEANSGLIGDTTTLSESTEIGVTQSPSTPGGGGGGGDHTLLQDTVTFIVRDADGVVKDQGILN